MLRLLKDAEGEQLTAETKLRKEIEGLKNKAQAILLQAEEKGQLSVALHGVKESRDCIGMLLDLRLEDQLKELEKKLDEMTGPRGIKGIV